MSRKRQNFDDIIVLFGQSQRKEKKRDFAGYQLSYDEVQYLCEEALKHETIQYNFLVIGLKRKVKVTFFFFSEPEAESFRDYIRDTKTFWNWNILPFQK